MRYITAQEGVVIPLGRQGENEVTTVKFDASGWADEYGAGSFELLHERCKDSAPYACPITVEDGIVSWVISNADTAFAGRGRAQLVYIVDAAVAKSVIYSTSVLRSIDADMEFPDPYENWLVQMHEDAEYVREHYEGALEAQENAEAWAVGQRSGEDVSEDDPTYHNNSKWHSQQSASSAQASADSAYEASRYAIQAAGYVGSPLTSNTKAGMTDTTKVYVYTGSESGMTNGHWYYYNGSAWTDGGVYNSIADDVATTSDIDELLYS